MLEQCGLEDDALLAIKLVAEEETGSGGTTSLVDIARRFGYSIPDAGPSSANTNANGAAHSDLQGKGKGKAREGDGTAEEERKAPSGTHDEPIELDLEEEAFMLDKKEEEDVSPAARAKKSRAASPSVQAAASRQAREERKEEKADADSKSRAPEAAQAPSAFSAASSSLNPPKMDLVALDRSIEAIPLHEDIFRFDPSTQVDTTHWPRDGSSGSVTTPYALLAHAFTLISSTRSRLSITTLLTNLLRVVRMYDPSSLLPTVYLISNHIAPAYDGIELGLGGSIVNKAILQVTGVSRGRMRTLWNATGDPGDVAFEAKKSTKLLLPSPPITVQRLFKTLHQIAAAKGNGSGNVKFGHVVKLLVASRGEETRFLVRTFISHLRIQAVKTTIATALARAFVLQENDPQSSKSSTKSAAAGTAPPSRYLITVDERQGVLANATKASERHDPRRLVLMQRVAKAESLVRQVRARHPNFSNIVPALLQQDQGAGGVDGGAPLACGLDGLSTRVSLAVGVPISPMLGSITRSLDDMHAKMGSRAFVSEFKYDGQRVQIHALHLARPRALCLNASGEAGAEELTFARKNKEWDKLKAETVPAGKGKWVSYAGGVDEGEIWVRLFSRHLEDMTAKYPDIVDLMPLLMGWQALATSSTHDTTVVGDASRNAEGEERVAADAGEAGAGTGSSADSEEETKPAPSPEKRERVTALIMDAEVVAIGLQGELLPFQTLSNRSRKDVNINDVKVKVGIFAFDLMYLDDKVRTADFGPIREELFVLGRMTSSHSQFAFPLTALHLRRPSVSPYIKRRTKQSLLKTSFRRRRQLLHTRFPPLAPLNPLIARFAHVRSCESNVREDVLRFFEQAQASKCEGIMVKSLDHHWETRGDAAAPEAKDTKGKPGESANAKGSKEEDEVAEGEEETRHLTVMDEEVADELVDEQGDEDEDESEVPSGTGIGPGVNGRGKALLSTYEPDKRVESWLKVKKDYIDGIGDSLDLVPIGGWHGMGRKSAWWSPVLLALYDPETATYHAVCKCISGFTDAEYKRIRAKFTPGNGNELSYDAREQALMDEYDLGGMSTPDVFFRPTEVWEIRGADITLSPVYTAALGLVSEERGLSIRFPRFIKRREDKGVEQASTPRDLANIYLGQQAGEVKRQTPKKAKDDIMQEDEEQDGIALDDHAGEALSDM